MTMILVSLISIGVGFAIPTEYASIFLMTVGFILILPLLTNTATLSVLTIIWGFSLFLFLAILIADLTLPQYTITKDIAYVIVLVVACLRHVKRSRQKLLAKSISYFLIPVYIILLSMYCFVTSPDLVGGLVALRSHIEFAPLAIIIPQLIRRNDVEKILGGILLLTVIIATVHIIDFSTTYNFVFGRGANRTLFGILNANILGTLYAAQLAILISLRQHLAIQVGNKRLWRMLLLVSIILLSVALVISLSRRNIVALALAIPVGYWLLNKHIPISRRLLTLIVVGAVSVLIYQYAPASVQERVQTIVESDAKVNVKRAEELYYIQSEYFANPNRLLMGRGFGVVGSDNIIRGPTTVYYHNYYVQILSDVGIVGLLLFLLIVGSILLGPLASSRSSLRNDPVIAAFFQGMLVVLIGNFFGTTLGAIPVNVFFWCYSGLMLYVTGRILTPEEVERASWNKRSSDP